MNGDDVHDAVTGEYKTELSRLGSSKALYALTGGEMEDDAVFAGAADHAHYAASTFGEWEGDLYADAADVAGEADLLDAHDPGDPPAVYGALADCESEAERLGGLLGWTLVFGKLVDQLTGYFTGQADPGTASEFRGVGGDVDDIQERVRERLDDADGEAAREAAGAAVEAAYDEYFETLEDLGVNPKPVC